MALVREQALVIAFDSTTAALAAERELGARGLPGRIIPLPREVSAGCGLSWKIPPSARESVTSALDEAGIPWVGAYELTI
jgi:hypothetical protein